MWRHEWRVPDGTHTARATRRGVCGTTRRHRDGDAEATTPELCSPPNRTHGCGGCRVRSEFKNRTEQKPHSAQATDDCTAAGWNGGAILLLLLLHHAARRPAIIQLEARGAGQLDEDSQVDERSQHYIRVCGSSERRAARHKPPAELAHETTTLLYLCQPICVAVTVRLDCGNGHLAVRFDTVRHARRCRPAAQHIPFLASRDRCTHKCVAVILPC